jgi:hypothetical protein
MICSYFLFAQYIIQQNFLYILEVVYINIILLKIYNNIVIISKYT